MKKLLVAALLLLGGAMPAHADFRSALDAYKRGDLRVAYEQFLPLAKHGDARSRLMLGVMNGEGKGVERNDFLAHVWFILAARSVYPGKLKDLAEKYRAVFAEDLSVAQMIEAGRLAREWQIKWKREYHRAGL